jgi:hypothetical protein
MAANAGESGRARPRVTTAFRAVAGRNSCPGQGRFSFLCGVDHLVRPLICPAPSPPGGLAGTVVPSPAAPTATMSPIAKSHQSGDPGPSRWRRRRPPPIRMFSGLENAIGMACGEGQLISPSYADMVLFAFWQDSGSARRAQTTSGWARIEDIVWPTRCRVHRRMEALKRSTVRKIRDAGMGLLVQIPADRRCVWPNGIATIAILAC